MDTFKNSIISSKVAGSEGNLGHRCAISGNVARAGGASEDAWVDSRVCRTTGQNQGPELAIHCEGFKIPIRNLHKML